MVNRVKRVINIKGIIRINEEKYFMNESLFFGFSFVGTFENIFVYLRIIFSVDYHF